MLFGIWPIFLSKSGLTWNVSAMIFTGLVFLFTAIVGVRGIATMGPVRWDLIIIASFLSAAGIICFNAMLAKATSQNIGIYLALVALLQISIPALYQSCMSGGISPTKCAGFIFAAIAATLLSKG